MRVARQRSAGAWRCTGAPTATMAPDGRKQADHGSAVHSVLMTKLGRKCDAGQRACAPWHDRRCSHRKIRRPGRRDGAARHRLADVGPDTPARDRHGGPGSSAHGEARRPATPAAGPRADSRTGAAGRDAWHDTRAPDRHPGPFYGVRVPRKKGRPPPRTPSHPPAAPPQTARWPAQARSHAGPSRPLRSASSSAYRCDVPSKAAASISSIPERPPATGSMPLSATASAATSATTIAACSCRGRQRPRRTRSALNHAGRGGTLDRARPKHRHHAYCLQRQPPRPPRVDRALRRQKDIRFTGAIRLKTRSFEPPAPPRTPAPAPYSRPLANPPSRPSPVRLRQTTCRSGSRVYSVAGSTFTSASSAEDPRATIADAPIPRPAGFPFLAARPGTLGKPLRLSRLGTRHESNSESPGGHNAAHSAPADAAAFADMWRGTHAGRVPALGRGRSPRASSALAPQKLRPDARRIIPGAAKPDPRCGLIVGVGPLDVGMRRRPARPRSRPPAHLRPIPTTCSPAAAAPANGGGSPTAAWLQSRGHRIPGAGQVGVQQNRARDPRPPAGVPSDARRTRRRTAVVQTTRARRYRPGVGQSRRYAFGIQRVTKMSVGPSTLACGPPHMLARWPRRSSSAHTYACRAPLPTLRSRLSMRAPGSHALSAGPLSRADQGATGRRRRAPVGGVLGRYARTDSAGMTMRHQLACHRSGRQSGRSLRSVHPPVGVAGASCGRG